MRTGPKVTRKPQASFTSCAATPGAESCGSTSRRCSTISASRVSRTRRATSAAQNVPLPAAHQTLTPRVSTTSSQASSAPTEERTSSNVSL